MKILFASGAPWNATDKAQRYQQLVLAMRQLGVEADFYCPYGSVDGDESPFLASEDKEYDYFICGSPEESIWQRNFKYRRFIVDVCDKWDGQMVVGRDFSAEFHRQIKLADIVIAVSPTLQVRVQEIAPGKPTFLVPNGVRDEVFRWKPRFAGKPVVVFWGAAYIGQEWWDLEALFDLPKRFRDIQFKYYFAADQTFTSDSPNLTVKVALRGVPFEVILGELTLPAVGLLPWMANNPVTWCADPIKAYEYAVLGMTIVSVNGLVPSEVRQHFSAFGDTKELLPRLVEQALEFASSTKPSYEPEKFVHWRWIERAKEILRILTRFA